MNVIFFYDLGMPLKILSVFLSSQNIKCAFCGVTSVILKGGKVDTKPHVNFPHA